MKDWWGVLLEEMLCKSDYDLMRLEATMNKLDTWADLALLMEAADHRNILRYAYDERMNGGVHVEVSIVTE